MISAIILGLGDRGKTYSTYAVTHPEKLIIIAVADPDEHKRNYFQEKFNLAQNNIFASWENILEKGKIADVAIITTPDHLHYEPAIKAMKLGYDILLEKPMAPTKNECKTLDKIAREENRILQICHVLRYSNFYSKINTALKTGKIGNIVNITMLENVSYYHYAHSFIRGNWHNRENSSPMILAKCCHDLDLMYSFAGAIPDKITSFGGLDHFKKDRDDLPARCTDGCPIKENCLYYAPRIYEDILPLLHITSKSGKSVDKAVAKLAIKFPHLKNYPPFSKINQYNGWPVSVITPETSIDAKRKALDTGPYGRCVYNVKDHNVVDHQVVSVLFENNITATLTMHGHSSEEGRYIRIDGTKGTIVGDFLSSGEYLEHIDSQTNKKTILYDSKGISVDHGGSDQIIISDFIDLIENKKLGNKIIAKTNSKISLISHLMAFAADESRIQNKIVEFEEFKNRVS